MLTPRDSAASIRGTLSPFQGTRLDPSSAPDLELVLVNARRLQQAADPLQVRALLRGKNLALMCESPDADDAIRFRDAAVDLGAHVAYLRTGLKELHPADVRRHTAHLLGRLYQGIECQGLPGELVDALGREAGIPVYDGIASATHPFSRLAELLEGRAPLERNRQLILQAVLVSTIG